VLSLPGLRQDGAQVLAEHLREALAREPAPAGSRRIPLTTSIGVAEASNGDTFAQLVAKADEALYRAKSGGRNQVVLAAPLPA
jgi:diguanylate cyclase (GGDEF)-like protein